MKNDIFENLPIYKAVGSLALPTMMGMQVMVGCSSILSKYVLSRKTN